MKARFRKNKILILAISVAVILSLNFVQSGVKGFFYDISSPMQKWFWGLGGTASGVFGTVPDVKDLQKQLADAQKINEGLLSELIATQNVEKENETLRAALGIGLQKDFKLQTAMVISKEIGQDSVVIDKGSSDGLAVNMPVVNEQKALLGRISEVYKYRSVVMLISNKNSSFDAEISDTGLSGLLKGQGGGNALLTLIPKDKTVSDGQVVASSALGGVFPQGLLVGSVSKVEINAVNPYQDADVTPYYKIADLGQVFIILNY